MDDELHRYYERELTYIFRQAREFGSQYRATASGLLLEDTRSNDPHVERLIESFALLTGRIRRKLDDEFPQVTDALLGVLYPHYLAPVPSMAIVQFELDPSRAELPSGFQLPKGTELLSQSIEGVRCQFRTAYHTRIWPIRVSEARFLTPPFPQGSRQPPGTLAAVRIVLETTTELPFSDLEFDRLRFFLNGEKPLISALYDTLFSVARGVDVSGGKGTDTISLEPSEALVQVGFEADESLLPYPTQSFRGYSLLTEFFAFPDKYFFIDIKGLAEARSRANSSMEIMIYLGRTSKTLEQGVSTDTFRLGCSPAVNLFEKVMEPIAQRHTQSDFRLLPDVTAALGYEVYEVQTVEGVEPSRNVEYQPFYSYKQGAGRRERKAFWTSRRRHSTTENDRGTEVFLSFVDLDFDAKKPEEPAIMVRALCSNRDLPGRLKPANFTPVAPAPLAPIRCLRQPTPSLRPPLGPGARWRLISHLNLNHLSIVQADDGPEPFREILRLYDFTDPDTDQAASGGAKRVIESIVALQSERVVDWCGGEKDGGFCRGVEVVITMDEGRLVGTGAMLFASLIERFLGLYSTINSFTRLVVKVRSNQGDTELRRWPPRSGEHPMI